jgi:hypothetical protein
MKMILSNTSEALFRIGLILLVCGIFVGLLFEKWTVIPIIGMILLVPSIVEKGILRLRESMSQEKFGT